MMFGKAFTRSGRKILRAIKKITNARMEKKLLQQQQQQQRQQQVEQQNIQTQQRQQLATWCLLTSPNEIDNLPAASSSLPSLDAKSVDTFVTYVADGLLLSENYYLHHCCCNCDEREENQRNENLENEMMH